MARRMIFLVACLCIATAAFGQRVTRTFNDVSMSEALKWLNEQGGEYNISFLYNELEDFRVTTSVKNKSVPDAIQQLIGFYPIKMTVQGKEIAVECPQKASTRYKGTVLDETGQPLPYANVALLSPRDSTLITGGVTNESGLFVIPCDQQGVLARITYVGYRPVYRHCKTPHLGTIKMQPDQYALDGVTVKGERPIVKAENGHLTYNIPHLLEILPADNAYEALTRIPGVTDGGDGLSFAGQSAMLIINGKPTTLSAEQVVERLKQMPAAQLSKAVVMPSAPARYHVRGMAINIVTKDFAGTNHFSGQLKGGWEQSKYGTGFAGGSIIYNHRKLGIDASYKFTDGTGYGQVEHVPTILSTVSACTAVTKLATAATV